jgi:lysophospholipase L1-like esterase
MSYNEERQPSARGPLGRRFALRKPRFARSALVIAGVGLAASSLVLGAPAHAAAIRYAALGDSFSSGEGADDYSRSAGSCLRSGRSFPALWAAAHSPEAFDFVACAGATTDDVRSTQLGVLNASTTLVTISVGGNDIGFKQLAESCRFHSTATCRKAVNDAISTAQTTLPASLAATYRDIKTAAPRARLVVLGYPRLFETGTSCGLFGINETKRRMLNDGTDLLDSVIRTQAQAAGATYVDPQDRFAGHRICSSEPWINGTVPLLVDSYHPNAKGHSLAYLPSLTPVIS